MPRYNAAIWVNFVIPFELSRFMTSPPNQVVAEGFVTVQLTKMLCRVD
jgi:hypothetical protein